ncbi:MAG: SDR family NAD(P)-dependent oxidoreductase [Magnetococcales bacterium]|nr:SDR family NAD(P)-dependent oxidoreductase [Magnetococcales bacterium]
MKTVLVTGGAGYVGSILIRRLLQRGDRVVCLDNLNFGGESLLDVWEHSHFHFHRCDITDTTDVDVILNQYQRIDAVVHLAAIVGDPACKRQPDLAYRTNWEASLYLLNQSVRLGISRFIFASTCSNYGKMADPGGFVDEGSPLSPVSLYAELKVRFEQYMLHEMERPSGFCPTALRFATVYGLSPRMRFDLTVNEFTKELALGRELVVFGEQFWRPYCHVADFSNAMLKVLDAAPESVAGEVFNVGDNDENYTKGMLLDQLLRRFPEARIRRMEMKDDPRDYRVRFDKIQQRLGFAISRTVADGIGEMQRVLELGILSEPDHPHYYNIPHGAP